MCLNKVQWALNRPGNFLVAHNDAEMIHIQLWHITYYCVQMALLFWTNTTQLCCYSSAVSTDVSVSMKFIGKEIILLNLFLLMSAFFGSTLIETNEANITVFNINKKIQLTRRPIWPNVVRESLLTAQSNLTHWRSIQRMKIFLPQEQWLVQESSVPPTLKLLISNGLNWNKSHVANIMFDNVIVNLSGKASFSETLTSFQFRGQTQALCVGGQCTQGFADFAPTGFVWPHSSSFNSI